MNKGRNDNLPRICQTEIEGDSTSCKVNRACVNFPVSFTSVLLESVPVFLFSNPNITEIGRFCDRDRDYFPISAFFFLSQSKLMAKFSYH